MRTLRALVILLLTLSSGMTQRTAGQAQRNAVYITTHALYNAVSDPAEWAQRLEGIDDRHTSPSAVFERLKQQTLPGAASRGRR